MRKLAYLFLGFLPLLVMASFADVGPPSDTFEVEGAKMISELGNLWFSVKIFHSNGQREDTIKVVYPPAFFLRFISDDYWKHGKMLLDYELRRNESVIFLHLWEGEQAYLCFHAPCVLSWQNSSYIYDFVFSKGDEIITFQVEVLSLEFYQPTQDSRIAQLERDRDFWKDKAEYWQHEAEYYQEYEQPQPSFPPGAGYVDYSFSDLDLIGLGVFVGIVCLICFGYPYVKRWRKKSDA